MYKLINKMFSHSSGLLQEFLLVYSDIGVLISSTTQLRAAVGGGGRFHRGIFTLDI